MLVVTKDASQNPAMIVSCEQNILQEEMIKSVSEYVSKSGPKIFFCYFDVEGTHYNVEPLYEMPNAETFKLKAFALIASTLGVSNEPELFTSQPKNGRRAYE